MKGRIAGYDNWMPRRELPAPAAPFIREVKDDFFRTDQDQFLTGKGGFWLVNYTPQHTDPNPWRSVTRKQLDQVFAETLEKSGLAEHLIATKVDVTASELFPRVHIKLSLSPASKLSDEDVYRAFSETWPKGQIPIPPLTVAIDISAAESGRGADVRAPQATSKLKTLFEVQKNGLVQVKSEHLDAADKKRLKQWAGTVVPGAQKQTPARQLLALLSSPTDLSTEKGRETVAAMKDLSLFSPFWSLGIDLLAARFKPRQLEHSMFVYNGHPTFAMTSLLPTLNAFKPAATNLWVGKKSGTPEAREIIRIQKPTAMFAEGKFTTDREVGMQRERTIADLLDTRMRMPQEEWGPFHMVVDKIGPWIEKRKGAIPRQVVAGLVRAIVHNRDDIDALKGLEEHIWGVDFANSEVKKMEALFIGEQFALMGAREARSKGWGRIGEVPVVVNGFGLLGEQTALALARLGMPRDKIVIRDLDPDVLERARQMGFSTDAAKTERAVVFNATPGVGVHAGNVGTFADDVIVLSMTSGGKGVDLQGLKANAAPGSLVELDVGRRSQQPIKDLDLEVGATKVRVIAEGFPPNLVDEMWGDRYQLTSMGVSAATLQAAELDEPGIARFDAQLDRDLVEAARASGLFERRPLDARPGEDAKDLLADLDAFAPR